MGNGGNDAMSTLAEQKRLPIEFLQRFHVRDVGKDRVFIPYGRQDGKSCARSRIRYCGDRKRFAWHNASRVVYGEDGQCVMLADGRVKVERLEIVPYGLWHQGSDLFRQYCILGEGESDAWACWFHSIPYLGIPGAQSHRCLLAEHVAGIPKIFLWQEPGQAGEQFVDNLNEHLRNQLNFEGQVRRLNIPDVKDPSDLHIADPDRFVERLEVAMQEAPLLPPPAAPIPTAPPRTQIDPSQPRRYSLQELICRDLGPPERSRQWRCPFHDDKGRPNLGIYTKDGRQRFKCQRCGAGGDDIEWLRRMHNMSFRQACDYLGLEIRDETPAGVDISHLLAQIDHRDKPPPEPEVDLDEWREQMAAARLESVGKPGVYLDRSQTGAGKTFADIKLCEASETSLTVLPSHANCRETEALYREHGLKAAAFPALDKDTCQNLSEAQQAQQYGFGIQVVVCPRCPFKDDCVYLSQMERAAAAPHRIATHKRAELTIKQLSRGRKLICIHEDASAILRPAIDADEGFHDVSILVRNAAHETFLLDDESRWFFHQMEQVCDKLAEAVVAAQETGSVDVLPMAMPPPNYQKQLWFTMQTQQIDVPPRAMQLVLAVMVRAAKPYVQVDRDAAGNIKRTIVAVTRVELAKRRVIWFEDATASKYELERMIDRPVHDMTPKGRLRLQHPVLLVPRDIKQSTSKKTVLNLLRGLLHSLPQYQQIGLIAHRRHLPLTSRLEESLRERIKKMSYFRAGDTRGSNDWYRTCDLIITLGTPRVPVSAVRRRLLQQGEHEAASLADGDWQPSAWTGCTPSGTSKPVAMKQYCNKRWRQAYELVVLSELRQCIGRGRSVLGTGVPVLVLTNEHLPFPLLEADMSPVNEVESRILQFMRGDVSQNWGKTLNNTIKGFTPIFTPRDIAAATGVSVAYVYDELKSLRSRGLVQHRTNPRGWSLSTAPAVTLGAECILENANLRTVESDQKTA